ncbi:MAG: hypothetical protein RL380_64 [Verrucomicrobiota bacterium]|jgi:hypothetical protein
MTRWGKSLGLLWLLLSFARADDTNAPVASDPADAPRTRTVREHLDQSPRGEFNLPSDSLQGMSSDLPNVARPQLSPAQIRRLQERADEERYWMFAKSSDTNRTSLTKNDGEEDSTLGQKSLTTGVPKILQRYLERQNATNAAPPVAEAPIETGSFARTLFGVGANGDAAHGVRLPADSASAFSRLFQSAPSGTQPLNLPTAATRSPTGLAADHRLAGLGQSFLAPEPVRANPLAPSTPALSGGSSLSGLGVLSSAGGAAGANALPGFNAPLRIGAPLPAPAPAPVQFVPVVPPKRRF